MNASVVAGHALRNALIPTVTVLGLTTASLLAGAVLTETIFSWPGIGSFAVAAALKLDYPALLGVTLIVAIIYVLVNLAVDIVYGRARSQDPVVMIEHSSQAIVLCP